MLKFPVRTFSVWNVQEIRLPQIGDELADFSRHAFRIAHQNCVPMLGLRPVTACEVRVGGVTQKNFKNLLHPKSSVV